MNSAREAVEESLARIDTVEGLVNSICAIDVDALQQADALDREASDGRRRGPLHGQVVVVKDNIDTAGLATTAGSLALTDAPPRMDADVVTAMRAAGLVVIGKANLSEWANMRDARSTSGWSAYGGLTRNPYGLNRSSGGSSSGSGAAVAAGVTQLAVGTETDGSIICPAAFNGCVGLKPTVGFTSTRGVVPISKSQDTVGPMTATVRQSAALLSVLAGDGVDYEAHAVTGRIAGKRVGVPRRDFWGTSPAADAAVERALGLLSGQGAVIVDETNLESMTDFGFDDELTVLLSELRAGLAEYLPGRPGIGVRTLDDVVSFNREHADAELGYFGQSYFEQALEGPEVGSPEYEAARARCLLHGRDEGLNAVFAEHELDVLITPSWSPAAPIDLVNTENFEASGAQAAAMAGYPLLTVPASVVHGLPVGVCFWGLANSETTLIEVAHGYEVARAAVEGPFPGPTFSSFI